LLGPVKAGPLSGSLFARSARSQTCKRGLFYLLL